MANHVPDPSSQNAALFGDFNYNNNFYDQGQPFSSGLLQEQQQHTSQLSGTPSHSPFSNHPSAFSPPPAWQNTAATSAIPNPQANPYLTTNRGYYGNQSPNTGTTFYPAHGAQFAQNVDPSLLRQADGRIFPQTGSLPPTASQSSATIAPSSLQQVLNRQVASPPVSMQNVFSMQTMSNPSRDLAVRPPAVNGSTPTQVPKAPKGVQHGNFIIVSFDELANATQSTKLAKFANIRSAPVELNLTKVNIPNYVPRKSQNELKSLSISDPTLKDKILKRVKKTKLHIQRADRSLHLPTNRGSPVSLSSETESSDDESDDSEYDSDSSPPPEKSPLPASRPQKAVEAVRYDTIKAVWFPRNKFAENGRILKGLADLWEVVRTIRDRWKSDRDAVKKALEAKQDSELPLLRERVEKQLEMMEAVLTAASEFGHPDLLNACGQNTALMATCYQFILEPVREGNYTGTFIKSVFKFLSMCSNLGAEVSEKTGLSKLFSRSIKRGNEEIKQLTSKINENIAATDKRVKAARNLDKPAKVNGSPKSVKPETGAIAGVKRAAPSDSGSMQSVKRVASGAAASVAKDSAAAKLGLVKKAGAPTTTPTATAAPKTNIVKPPTKATTSFFGLQSASKKPGTSKADQANRKPTPGTVTEKKATPNPVAAARPAFSFAETMANLSKEKKAEEAPAKKKNEENRPPETPEEKAKRLRKEQRRQLRVRWKTDFDLVEVRTFSPDPSEMSGNARNVRDVGNGKEKEGFTLKKHMDMMDVDEEDDGQPMEQTYFEYHDPSTIDFSSVPEDERARNYEKFGGRQKVDSKERAVQDNHEANTLMVHYLAKSDIPPSPREPADPYNGITVEMKSFGYPDETSPWLMERLKKNPLSVPAAAPQIDISALLQSINAQPQQPQQEPVAPVPDLSRILASVTGGTSQSDPSQQQAYGWAQQQPTPAALPQEQAQTNSLESILAALTGGTSTTQPPTAAPPAPPMVALPAAAAQQVPAANPDVNALIAQLMQNSQQPGAAATNMYAPYNPSDGQDPNYNNYYSAYATNTNGTNDQAGQKRKWTGTGTTNPSKKFTHPCRFWKDGKCKKGDACTFRHD